MHLRKVSILFLALLFLCTSGLAMASTKVSANGIYLPTGIKLQGKVKVVDHGADIKIQVVNSFPDLKVQSVKSFPDKPGKWQFVDSFPDFTVQYVTSFPDLKVQFVDSFPGVP